jgi:Motility related/secretion protein
VRPHVANDSATPQPYNRSRAVGVAGLVIAVLGVVVGATGVSAQQEVGSRVVELRLEVMGLPAFLTSGVRPRPAPTLRLGLAAIPLPVSVRFRLPDIVMRGPLPNPTDWMLGRGGVRLRRSLDASLHDLFSPIATAPSRERLARAARRAIEPDDEDLPFVTDLSGLDIEIVGRPELAGDWTRFQPCEAGLQAKCEPDLIPQLNPDMEFKVRVKGNVSDRIRLDVDFDQAREFSAANRINIFYEGKEDEVLQRLDLGDVTFQLPASRFLTEGIPAGNFGFQAEGQLGPLNFRGVWAQQRGDLSSREFRLTGPPGKERFVQADTLVLDDADYVRGQFFFLIDPSEIRDFPHLDVLNLEPSAAPPSVAPGIEPIQLYRFEADATQRQQVQGLIQADAVAGSGQDVVEESGWFRYLVPGRDYTIHSSGLWIVLSRPLRSEEMLAVTYINGAGVEVGDYNPERIYNAGQRPRLKLLKASNANHQPGRPTWDQEMHQVYRVSGASDVDPATLELTISLGELSAGRTFARGRAGEDITWLRLFGLDEESPIDELDLGGIYRPAQELFFDQPAVEGTFIVFPTLRPFAVAPPVPSLGLTGNDTKEILGGDANPRIYDAGDPFDRENGGLFRLTIPYERRSQDVISSFSLGAFAIRDGSERIFLSDRLLLRDVDYRIDYDVGQVTLIRPEVLFASALDPVIRATWEQKSLFQVAPTTVFGFNGYVGAGRWGGFNLLALHQGEQTLVRRPQLGVEPAAITLGGMSMDFEFPAGGLDRLVESIPGLRLGGASRVAVEGEVALSLPNPNTRRDVFVDDFDAANERSLSLFAFDWIRGSAPAFRDGAEDVLPIGLDENDFAGLVWQHTWVQEGVVGDSLGVFEGFLPKADIDRQINVTGSQAREKGLRMNFTPKPGAGGASWRSITTSLSQTGLDITRSDFIEFYAAGGKSLTLVVDLGAVAEDAMFTDSQGRVRGSKSTGVPWGLGILDHEADPRRAEIWSDILDQVGVWDESCLAQRGAVYRLGDPRANCTRGNGRQDSEDLDGDGNLDTLERHLRFVVRLDGRSPFLVRTEVETGTQFQLYRIPIRGADALQIPRLLSEADFRAVKHLRLTVVGEVKDEVTLTRMRIIGSRWVKRIEEGVLSGIVGDVPGMAGRVEVGPVSRVTEGAAYQAPPGVLEELDDPTSVIGGQGIEFNEKGLKIVYEAVDTGERAEVFNRFPQRPQDFLTYRQMRLWAVARKGDWSSTEPLFFFVKVGEDADNFYLYRTPLNLVTDPNGVTRQDWLPEILIDFDEWIDLRRRAEEELIFNPPDASGKPFTIWSADSTYAVVLKDRARAPNLAAVREVSVGVWNERGMPTSGEIWVNEMRLSDAIRDAGVAAHFAMDLDASDVLTTRVSVSSRGAFFRQLADGPSFQTDRSLSVNSTLRADRFAPASWGVEIPINVSHSQTGQTPSFLAKSDVRADKISALRKPSSRRTRVDIQFRKSTPTSNPIVGLILDGLEARAGYFTAETRTITSVSRSNGFDARVDYGRSLGRKDVGVMPGFMKRVARWILPGSLGDRVAEARLRWTPERIRVGADYARMDQDALRFDRIVELDEDSLAVATRSPREAFESAMEVTLHPLENLTASADLVSTRDLLPPSEAVSERRIQELLAAERTHYGGLDLGWETNRLIRTNVDFRPRFANWLSGRFGHRSFYTSDRNAAFVRREVTSGDTLFVLERDVSGQRTLTSQAVFSPARVFVGPVDETPVLLRPLRRMAAAIQPISVEWTGGLTSRFDRESVLPGTGYQFGLGSRDDFLLIDGDSATSITDQTTWTARSGVRFPGGLQVGTAYRRSVSKTLDTRSDRNRVQRTWPDLTASLTALTMPVGFPLLRQVTLSAGFRRTTDETSFGGEKLQRRFGERTSVPITLRMTWGGAVRTAYQGRFTTGRGEDPTGLTELETQSHSLTLAAAFLPPAVVARHLDRPLTTSLEVRYSADRNCRLSAGQDECVAFLDEIFRELNFGLDTAVDRMGLRFQISYTDRQSFVGLASGTTQFYFGLFGNFTIAGTPTASR